MKILYQPLRFLEQFAAAFRRDMALKEAMRIKVLRRRLDPLYMTPTEADLTGLNNSEE